MDNIKIIKNIDLYSELCIYNIEEKVYKIVKNDNKIKKINKGFYCKVKSEIYGIVESHNGPVFFYNNKIYYLKQSNYSFEHMHLSEKIGKFELLINEKVIISLVYDITPFTDYDVWSVEKDVDFFQWICQSQENIETKERFHQFYTS